MAIHDSRVFIPEGIVLQHVENEAVVISLLTEKYFSLDEIGTHIWDAIISTSSIQEAIEILLLEYKVEQSQLEQDVLKLVQELEDFGLISMISTSE
ncbi:MAG: PqqD family protein [Chloroflexi bacterium]|nr:PqqD family protein [Chloroflexota bacterium]